MDSFLTQYQALSTSVVGFAQRFGLLTIPIIIVIAVLANMFAGEKAIRAIGATLAVVAVLIIVLNNAVAIGTFFSHPTVPATTVVTATPAPAAAVRPLLIYVEG